MHFLMQINHNNDNNNCLYADLEMAGSHQYKALLSSLTLVVEPKELLVECALLVSVISSFV